MTISNELSFRMAEASVRGYTQRADSWKQQHTEAMDCRDCEEFIQSGLEAFKWLCRSEQLVRQASYRGLCQFDDDTRSAFDMLYRAWLKPCDFAEEWIQKQVARGYTLDNLEEFRDACESVEYIIEHRGWVNETASSLQEQLSKEDW